MTQASADSADRRASQVQVVRQVTQAHRATLALAVHQAIQVHLVRQAIRA